MTEREGRIVKGISGFYYVYTAGSGIYACRAKGLFRKEGKKPLVGDLVSFTVTDEKDKEGNVETIYPRGTELLRPAVANVDQVLLLFAVRTPDPNLNLLDRFLLRMAAQSLPVLLCFNKTDLADADRIEALRAIYRGSGADLLFVSARTGDNMDALRAALQDKTTTVAGPSGVGKSTIVNALQDKTVMETGALSEKIERGRHTTRHTELLPINDTSFILDTPGFSSLDLPQVTKEELPKLYPEFLEYEPQCRFGGCSHIAEPDCGVKAAVEAGKIARERYENYRLFSTELSTRRSY